MKHTPRVPDDLNPEFIFNGTATDLLVLAVNGGIDLKQLAARTLANRGLDKKGIWVGFEKASKIHNIK